MGVVALPGPPLSLFCASQASCSLPSLPPAHAFRASLPTCWPQQRVNNSFLSSRVFLSVRSPVHLLRAYTLLVTVLAMDVASVRAEIKAWERDFRAKHGRDPSVQEIKDQPAIGMSSPLHTVLPRSPRI